MTKFSRSDRAWRTVDCSCFCLLFVVLADDAYGTYCGVAAGKVDTGFVVCPIRHNHTQHRTIPYKGQGRGASSRV